MNKCVFVKTDGGVFLRREEHKQPWHIATLKGDVLIVPKKPGHLYFSTNSYGFNLEMVTNLSFGILRVILSSGEILETTKTFLLQKGVEKEHESYEPQIFLPVKEFGLEKAREFEEDLKRKQRCRSITIYEALEILKRGGKK
jgi:hypothetical protein